MSTVPTPANLDELNNRLERNPDFRDGYVEGYLDALAVARLVKKDTVDALGSLADRRRALTADDRKAILGVLEVLDGHLVHLCCGKIDNEEHRNFCEHYRTSPSPAERFLAETAARWQREYADRFGTDRAAGACQAEGGVA